MDDHASTSPDRRATLSRAHCAQKIRAGLERFGAFFSKTDALDVFHHPHGIPVVGWRCRTQRGGGMLSDAEYGESFVRQFRADAVAQLVTPGVKKSRLLVSRLRRDTPGHGLAAPNRPDAVFSVLLQLREQTHRELFLDERCVHRGAYPARTVSIVNHLERPTANLLSPFDNLIFIVPRLALHEIADDQGVARIDELHCERNTFDETIWHLGQALLPALERPHEIGALYAEHVMIAINTYFARAFGSMRVPRMSSRCGLAPRKLQRVTDLMLANLERDVSLSELAAECKLSHSYFTRAFKRSTGESPHRWLLRQRVERAKELLREGDVALSEIAIACGFADQSHFTRVFRSLAGASPGSWRRAVSN
jgi:AraC family transcriptional regulator